MCPLRLWSKWSRRVSEAFGMLGLKENAEKELLRKQIRYWRSN